MSERTGDVMTRMWWCWSRCIELGVVDWRTGGDGRTGQPETLWQGCEILQERVKGFRL